MKAIHLRTEYLENPLGLGITSPRFYWKCEGGIKQTAYQIIAKAGTQTLWNSGKVESASMTHITYAGRPLKSRERVHWSVKLWDENGEGGPIESAWFELGLLEASDWQAKWISGNYKPRKNTRWPVDHFRKTFIAGKAIRRARLYITACGLYEASINGHQVGDFILAPGCTDYRKRLQYQAYDVTQLLRENNTIEVMLADGWYRGSIGCFGQINVFGRRTKLLCQLEITCADGSVQTVVSDDSWDWCNDGPIRFADLKDGEICNAGMTPSFGGKAVAVAESMVPTASDNVFPKEQEVFTAKLLTTPSGKQVLDFGQNIAGYLAFSVHGKPGQVIHLTCGEILDENGEFTQKNMVAKKPVKEFGTMTEILLMTGNESKVKGEMQPTPRQEIIFTCSGQEDHYRSRFTVFGFRYALIEADMEFDPADFKAIAVYSDLEQTGSFACSDPKINQLYHNALWSMKGNFLDVPTDCPTRERLGWTGDAQVFFDTGAYMMHTAPFFRKWLRDVRDGQFASGKLSAVVPYNGLSMLYDNTGASVGWGDCAVLLPYRYWKRFGDVRALEENYGVMRGYAMFMIKNCGHKDKKAAQANPYNQYTYEKGMHLGEWLEPEEFQDKIAAGHSALHTEECTAYLHYTMTHMAEAARELGREADAALFREYADGAQKAYHYLFLKNGAPDTDRQAKLIRPLAFGIARDEVKTAVENRLAQAVENRNYRIGTGFLSTPFVLKTLTDMGRADLAYKMLENKQQPGWLYEVEQGATTIWESWEGEVSHNHYSPGAVCQWLFDTVCGIRPDGENRFILAPVPGGTLTHAQASYDSLYGEVMCGWEKTDTGVKYMLKVPANTTAELLVNGERRVFHAGSYELQM